MTYTQTKGLQIVGADMLHSVLTRQRLVGIFLTGLLLLYSPATTLFDHAAELGGIPVSYLYLFGVWLLLVVLAAITVEADNR